MMNSEEQNQTLDRPEGSSQSTQSIANGLVKNGGPLDKVGEGGFGIIYMGGRTGDKEAFLEAARLLNTDRYEESIAVFDRLLEQNPKYLNAHLNKGLAHKFMNENEKAIDAFTAGIKASPGTAKFYDYRAQTNWQLGRYKECIADATEFIRLEPTKPIGYDFRGRSWLDLGESQKAVDDLTKGIELNPKDLELYLFRSKAFEALGKTEEAEMDMKIAKGKEPHDYRGQESLALNKDTFELRKKELGPEHRDTLAAMHNLALSYSKLGRDEEALTLREKTLELKKKTDHPSTLLTMESLAYSYGVAGRHEEALALREEILKLRSEALGSKHQDTLRAISSLAYAHLKARNFEKAETQFREYIAIREKQGADDWQFPYAQSSLGSVLAEQEKYTEAEPLLLAGHNGLETIEPIAEPKWLRFSIDRLVRLYTDWGKPKEAANWQAKLDALERAAVTPGATEYRLFTDVFGQKTEARIVKVENGQVMLEERDGNTLRLPLKLLPEDEQKAVADFESRN